MYAVAFKLQDAAHILILQTIARNTSGASKFDPSCKPGAVPAGVSTPAVVPQSLFAGPSSARLCLRKRTQAVLLASMHVTAVLGQLNQEAANSSGKETRHRERRKQTVTRSTFLEPKCSI